LEYNPGRRVIVPAVKGWEWVTVQDDYLISGYYDFIKRKQTILEHKNEVSIFEKEVEDGVIK